MHAHTYARVLKDVGFINYSVCLICTLSQIVLDLFEGKKHLIY